MLNSKIFFKYLTFCIVIISKVLLSNQGNFYSFIKKMSRKIQTSSSKRKFYHQQSQHANILNNNLFLQNNIIRPPTSHPYSSLNHYRSSTKIRNQYQSNYFTGKIFIERKNNQLLQKHPENKHLHHYKSKLSSQQQQIPKSFRLLISQIKVLLKNSLSQQDQCRQVLKSLVKRIRQIHIETKQLGLKLDEKQLKMKQLEQKNIHLQAKVKQHNTSQHRSHVQLKNNYQKQLGLLNTSSALVYQTNNKIKGEFQLMLENLHLSQLNQSYLNKIKQLQSQSLGQQNPLTKTNKQFKKSHDHDSDSSTDYLRFHNRINYLEMKIANSQQIQAKLIVENQQYIQIIEELNEQIAKLKEDSRKFLEQKNQWRERALMQKEDSETNITRQNFLLFSIKKLREVNKNLTDKILNINSQEGAKKLKQLQPNPYFQYEIDFFKSLKSIYFESKFKQYRLSLQSKKDSFQIQAIGLQHQYIEYRKHQEINLVGLNYYRPTFFSLIQECITNDIYTCRIKGSTSVSRIFIQVLRAILNSKVNQFMIMGSEEKFSRFPEFVYSWFEKFYFNSQKNQLSALQPYMQKPISQELFYRDLMNVKLDQSWEIITFREFLLEQLNLEQLYFYLMCQNLLYKKAGINDQIQYLGQFCIFVQFSSAKSVLDLVLSDFESWNVSFLTSKLRQKIVIKKNQQFIESGFFLRCLVQYYKIQRINRYKYIAKLCDQFKSCQLNGLRFSSFVSVINRFTQISAQQKVRLYRDCYSVGKGKITADVIFTVCTQQLIFLRYLKLKSFYRLPTIISYKDLRKNKKKPFNSNSASVSVSQQESSKTVLPKKQIICVQPSDSYIYEIFIGLNRLLSDQKNFSRRIQKLGVAQILQHFQTIKKLFGQRSSNNDSSLLKCRHFIHFISATMQKIRQISFQNFYDLLDQNNKKKGDSSSSNFWIEISQTQLCQIFTQQFKATFEIFEKINSYRLWKQDIYNFRLNNAARKIQRQVRKKFIEPFMQLYKIIYSELKKDDGINKEKQRKEGEKNSVII